MRTAIALLMILVCGRVYADPILDIQMPGSLQAGNSAQIDVFAFLDDDADDALWQSYSLQIAFAGSDSGTNHSTITIPGNQVLFDSDYLFAGESFKDDFGLNWATGPQSGSDSSLAGGTDISAGDQFLIGQFIVTNNRTDSGIADLHEFSVTAGIIEPGAGTHSISGSGSISFASASVPEPGAMLPVLLAVGLFSRRKRL